MKNTPLRAILVHSGPDSGAFYLTDGTLLTESFQGKIKGYRTIYRYQPDFRYPSPLYLLYPKDYLSYIADPAKDAELQNLLRCWDEGEGPIASREECCELVVRRKGKPTLRVIVRPHDCPRIQAVSYTHLDVYKRQFRWRVDSHHINPHFIISFC